MAHFYLALPSNSSMKYYPSNTAAHFTTKLENGISLSGDWEVGLIEIHYPHTWNNITSDDCEFIYWQESKKYSDGLHWPGDQKTIQLPTGYYENMHDIVYAVNTNIQEFAVEHKLDKYSHFKYDTITKTLKGEINLGAGVRFSTALCFILGIDERQNPIYNLNFGKYDAEENEEYYKEHYEEFNKVWDEVPDVEWESEYIGDINPAFSSIHVYCNILSHVPVGDTTAPLLRIVHIEGKNGDNVHIMYENAVYVPLQQKSFDSIEIDIRGDTGNAIPFEYGKSFVLLHFRQCKKPHLIQ